MKSFSDVNWSFWYVATNYLTDICFERLDSPRHKVVNSPAYDGVVEHSHVDVDHTDSVTNLGKWKGGEDGWSKIKAKKYASPLSKLDRSSSKEIGSHIWLKHVIPIFIYQPWQLMFLRSLETVHHHTCGTGQGRVPCRKGGGLRTPAWWSMVSGRPLIYFNFKRTQKLPFSDSIACQKE